MREQKRKETYEKEFYDCLKISKKIISLGILFVLCLGITACKNADTISVVTETESQS